MDQRSSDRFYAKHATHHRRQSNASYPGKRDSNRLVCDSAGRPTCRVENTVCEQADHTHKGTRDGPRPPLASILSEISAIPHHDNAATRSLNWPRPAASNPTTADQQSEDRYNKPHPSGHANGSAPRCRCSPAFQLPFWPPPTPSICTHHHAKSHAANHPNRYPVAALIGTLFAPKIGIQADQ